MRKISVSALLVVGLHLFLFAGSPSHAAMEKEKTLAMIKPDGLSGNYTDKIRKVILESGFDIIREMMVQLDVGNVTLFYAEHSKKSFFPSLVEYMTSGPVFIMVLEKPNAISDWRALIGPTDSRKAKVSHPNSIRAMCGLDSARNCVHGSDSPQSAAREISFFFGDILLDTTLPDICKDEFSDWPQALFTIGTFGNSELKEDTATYDSLENLSSLQDQPDLTLEEVIKFQKELAKLLALKPKSSIDGSEIGWEKSNLPLNEFQNCSSSLDIDQTSCVKFCDGLDDEDNCDPSPSSKVILNTAKNLLADHGGAIKKKSISFLLKKMFACKSGFGPARNLRDPFLESKIGKLLKTILHKKIHPQNSNSTSKMKYLEKKQKETTQAEDKMHEKEKDSGKWVKTDSEYIVLEM